MKTIVLLDKLDTNYVKYFTRNGRNISVKIRQSVLFRFFHLKRRKNIDLSFVLSCRVVFCSMIDPSGSPISMFCLFTFSSFSIINDNLSFFFFSSDQTQYFFLYSIVIYFVRSSMFSMYVYSQTKKKETKNKHEVFGKQTMNEKRIDFSSIIFFNDPSDISTFDFY